jgi:hypothetical protein
VQPPAKVETKIVYRNNMGIAAAEAAKGFEAIAKIANRFTAKSSQGSPVERVAATPQPKPSFSTSSSGKKPGGAERMLLVLASRHPMTFTKPQLALLAKLSHKSGSFGTYLSTLRANGFLAEDNGQIGISDAGLEQVGASKPEPQTQEEILQMWKDNLKGGARRMFEHLLDIYPRSVSRTELGFAAGISSTSGSFGTYLSMLKRNGLISVVGSEIKANNDLFVDRSD